MEIKYEVKGLEDWMKRLSEEALRRAVRAGLSEATGKVESRAIEFAPKDTSNLFHAITSYLEDDFTGVVTVTNAAPYAVFVHEGTGLFGPKKRKYEIRPKKKKALYWPDAKHPVKKVLHPGIKPQPFLRQALEKTDVRGIILKHIKAVLNGQE